jgi:uncharacterized protein (TIGR01777 family)
MTAVLSLLLVQCFFGACDTLWHHEITERLPQMRSARRELLLHATREFLYGLVFLGLAWREWRGLWAWAFAAVLLIEILLTLADFLEEDRTRRLPATERVLHTVLAVNYGIWLGVFLPRLGAWSSQATSLPRADYGWLSLLLTAAAGGVMLSALRNFYASLQHSRPPFWLRHPFYLGYNGNPRTFLVTGATGFIGTAVVRRLLARGDSVIALTRSAPRALERFGPHARIIESLEQIEDATRIDGIVNLAGAPILALPWTRGRRAVLLQSRLRITHELVRLCRRLQRPPTILVSGSAIGFYGALADEECDEGTRSVPQFQSELCRKWERAATEAKSSGVRVVLVRTGFVLGAGGGALPRLALPIRLFVGATLGSGRQWVSWIHLDDLVRLIELALDRVTVRGPLNATAPHPVRHAQFQRQLATQLRRPMWAHVPGWLLRVGLGEMAELLIGGQRVLPRRSLALGFQFRYPEIEGALAALFRHHAPLRPGRPAQVYFNGQCRVCNAEMSYYAGIAKSESLPISFIDSTRDPQSFARYGLRGDHLERRVYLRDGRGHISSGLDALLELWRALPRYRWLARVLSVPGLRQIATAFYDLMLAPSLAWSARRRASSQPR